MAKEHAEKVKTYQENEVPLATAETLVNKNMTKKFKESGVQKAEESLQKEVDDLKASLAKTDAERADWNDTRKEDLVGMVEHGKQQLEMTKKYQ